MFIYDDDVKKKYNNKFYSYLRTRNNLENMANSFFFFFSLYYIFEAGNCEIIVISV